MTRILQAMAGAPHGGAEAFFERLAIALDRAGETQKLVIRREAARAARLRGAGLDVEEAAFGRALDVTSRARLTKIIAAFKPRVVLSWMSRATATIPRGDFVHVARLGGYYDLRYYKHCDHLIGNTHALTEWLVAQGWPAARAHYLPNFAEIAALPPLPRADLATPDGAPLALALGRLHPNKGFDVLLDAVAKVSGLYLWLAGEGPLEHALKRQAASLGIKDRVRFLGWRDDAAALLAACDMLVCSSRSEPLGNTIIEAWAARRAVVACAASGPAELIRSGETGLLVPVDDAGQLAAAIAALVADKPRATALGEAGQGLYAAQFSEAPVVARYRDFLATVTR
ncbi:MAG TPA: glycosyltransferase [Stellaceae bacterium]|jgi:glycosyltransferase involved in cell wall biosynthesis|nr:glycosyltransferase [Stellaceae bacterium]